MRNILIMIDKEGTFVFQHLVLLRCLNGRWLSIKELCCTTHWSKQHTTPHRVHTTLVSLAHVRACAQTDRHTHTHTEGTFSWSARCRWSLPPLSCYIPWVPPFFLSLPFLLLCVSSALLLLSLDFCLVLHANDRLSVNKAVGAPV